MLKITNSTSQFKHRKLENCLATTQWRCSLVRLRVSWWEFFCHGVSLPSGCTMAMPCHGEWRRWRRMERGLGRSPSSLVLTPRAVDCGEMRMPGAASSGAPRLCSAAKRDACIAASPENGRRQGKEPRTDYLCDAYTLCTILKAMRRELNGTMRSSSSSSSTPALYPRTPSPPPRIPSAEDDPNRVGGGKERLMSRQASCGQGGDGLA